MKNDFFEKHPEIRKVIAIDFDGTLNDYSKGDGWKGYETINGSPIDDAAESIQEIKQAGFKVLLYSSRCKTEKGREALSKWLDKNKIVVDEIYDHKPSAYVYIDDRAIQFTGNWNLVLLKIKDFRHWIDDSIYSDHVDDKLINFPDIEKKVEDREKNQSESTDNALQLERERCLQIALEALEGKISPWEMEKTIRRQNQEFNFYLENIKNGERDKYQRGTR